ncbi:MAG: glycosyltransferase [bacterium]|nr:glycosyltransferase [bacterium]
MSISICIPTYNRLPSLKRLIESIFKGFGNYPYEVIVADDGSTDGTIEYLKGFSNITLIEKKELRGAVKAFNSCFKVAKGDYIFFSNDDFILVPEVLIKACKLMDDYKEIGLVAPKVEEPVFANLPGVEIFSHALIISKAHIFRASVLREMNYFDENFKTYAIDDDSCLSVLKLGYSIIFTREVGIIHNRVRDKLKDRNLKISNQGEIDYFWKKWAVLNSHIDKYLRRMGTAKYKLKIIRLFCRAIFRFKLPGFFPQKIKALLIQFYDRLLEQCIVFKVKEYENLKDFYLGQKLPREVLEKII